MLARFGCAQGITAPVSPEWVPAPQLLPASSLRVVLLLSQRLRRGQGADPAETSLFSRVVSRHIAALAFPGLQCCCHPPTQPSQSWPHSGVRGWSQEFTRSRVTNGLQTKSFQVENPPGRCFTASAQSLWDLSIDLATPNCIVSTAPSSQTSR